MPDELNVVDPSSTAELNALGDRYALKQDFTGRIDQYVAWEWSRTRHILESPLIGMAGMDVLELGCNRGATSVVMASLGAHVWAVDIEPRWVEATRLTARRYGVAHRIVVARASMDAVLHFPDARFDRICCNSVLEYVADSLLLPLYKELDRVLRPGGILCILGTSNRLYPREVHSHRWLVNYWPRSWDKLFRKDGSHYPRGVWPWDLWRAFPEYVDLDARDRSRTLLACRREMGESPAKLAVMNALRLGAALAGVAVGVLFPSIQMTLQKPG
jgi:SAM-dependent methyltransferase